MMRHIWTAIDSEYVDCVKCGTFKLTDSDDFNPVCKGE